MKAAIISRNGLGDGLLMMIFSYHLSQKYKVTFFHRLFFEMKSFFPYCNFSILKKNLNEYLNFDLIIVEYFNDPFIKKIIKNRNILKKIIVIYPTRKEKLENNNDFILNKKTTIAENFRKILEKILNKKNIKKENGIVVKNKTYKKYKKRIVLCPTSTDILKNYRKKRFIKLYYKLKNIGYNPIFSLAYHEKNYIKEDVKKISFENYSDLTNFLYESSFLIGNDSGPSHLASNLKIKTITLASSKKKMNLWKADFHKNILITPPFFLINFKFLKFRNKFWGYFISSKKILKAFLKNV